MQRNSQRPAKPAAPAGGRQVQDQTPGSPASPAPAAQTGNDRDGATNADDPRFANLANANRKRPGARKD
jgi:hypothetical protein